MDRDPRALALLTALADELRLPHALTVGVGQGESRLNFDPAGNDGGKSAGLLQVVHGLHGGPPERWTGYEGAIASINLMRPRWAQAARFAPSAYEWQHFGWDQRVDAFARWWIAAQGPDEDKVWKKAADVLRETEAILAGQGQQGGGMVTDPGIKWYTPAHQNGYTTGRPAGVNYEGLVYHTTAGGTTLEALAAWFARSTTRASTWFGADPAGKLGQFVSLNNTAHAHGLTNGIEHATARLVRENYALGVRDPNTYLIALELLDGGIPGNHTTKQLEAAAHWGAWMWQEHIAPHAHLTGAVVDRDHVLGHFEIDNRDRPNCPSWTEERFAWMIARIKEHLAGPVVEPPAPSDYLATLVAEYQGWMAGLRDDEVRIAVRIEDVRRKLAALGVEA